MDEEVFYNGKRFAPGIRVWMREDDGRIIRGTVIRATNGSDNPLGGYPRVCIEWDMQPGRYDWYMGSDFDFLQLVRR